MTREQQALSALAGIATYAGAMRSQVRAHRVDPVRILEVLELEARAVIDPAPAIDERPPVPIAVKPSAQALAAPPRVTREKAVELLLDPPPLVERMGVYHLLLLIPDLGHDGARRLLRRARVPEHAKVGSLRLRGERLVLASALRGESVIA